MDNYYFDMVADFENNEPYEDIEVENAYDKKYARAERRKRAIKKENHKKMILENIGNACLGRCIGIDEDGNSTGRLYYTKSSASKYMKKLSAKSVRKFDEIQNGNSYRRLCGITKSDLF